MGGTLSASPVILRKKQVTERRQVMSNVEVSKNGITSMSMTQAFRMERKSESDATVSVIRKMLQFKARNAQNTRSAFLWRKANKKPQKMEEPL